MSWGTTYAEEIEEPCAQCGRGGFASYQIADGYTWNTNNMMYRALEAVGTPVARLHDLEGRNCGEVASLLVPALQWWANNHDSQRELNPQNGWGNEVGAFEFWASVASGCATYPKCVLRLNG